MKPNYPVISEATEPKWLGNFRNFSFKRVFRSWWMVALLILLGIAGFAQNAIVGAGFAPGWGGSCGSNADFQYLGASAGSSFIRTTQANGTGNQYFRMGVDWDGQRRQHTLTLNTDVKVMPGVEYNLNNTCTTDGAMFIDVASTSHNYIFKTFDATSTPQYRMIFFKVEGAVRSITHVSVPATVTAGETPSITATLDGALAPGQGVYLRYTKDGFSTSTVLPMAGSGTSYTAQIPAFGEGTQVKYYCFTSGNALSIPGGLADFYTINASTNGGLNYGYTVAAAPAIASIANGNWNAGSTWQGGVVPDGSFAKAIVRHAVTLNTAATVKDLEVEPAGALTNTNFMITIADGGTITNKGVLDFGSGVLFFQKNGSILDSLGLAFVKIGDGTVNLGGSSVSGWLQLAGSGAVSTLKPPVYLDNSTLWINTGGNTPVGGEWTPTLQPYHLLIEGSSTYVVCNSSPTAGFALRGGVILNAGSKLMLDPMCNGNTIQPAGPFTSVNFLTIGADLNISDGCSLIIQKGDLGSLKEGTRFQLLVKGNLNNEGLLQLNDQIGDDLYLQGDWSNFGVFNPGGNGGSGLNPVTQADGRAVFLTGNALQQINSGSESFHYLIINNPAGVIFKDELLAVSRGISFMNGKLNLNGHTLKVGTIYNGYILGKIYGGNANSYGYNGTVSRLISNKAQPTGDDEQVAPNTGEAYVFPVGTADHYRPYSITYTAFPEFEGILGISHLSGAGVVTGSQPDLTDGDGVPIKQHYTNAYWLAEYDPFGAGANLGTFNVSYTCTNCMVGNAFPEKIRAIRRTDPAGTWSLPGTLVATTGNNASPTVGRSGLTGFSQYGLGFDPVVLPVKLKSFTGERTNSGNLLKWVSSSELNFSHYELQRSDDSRNYTMIARVNARHGNFEQAYNYADQKATGLVYYRLRLVDKDGSAAYSPVVSLKGSEPIVGKTSVVFEKSTGRILLKQDGGGFLPGTQAALLDMNGRILGTVKLASSGAQFLQTGHLASGVYLVQLYGKQGNETLKVMVQ